jgi:hypothetical protein
MITTASPTQDSPSARTLPRLFSNFTRCANCRGTSEIRVNYCPGCATVSGDHFHRVCRCGAAWLERSAGHAGVDISLDEPALVLICQHCRTRMNHIKAMTPKCCRTPEVSYHDTREACELCTGEREPGAEG